MKRIIFFNKVFYVLPIIALDKRDEQYNILYIGWFSFLYYKKYKKASK